VYHLINAVGYSLTAAGSGGSGLLWLSARTPLSAIAPEVAARYGESALWIGIGGLATVLVNGLVAVWAKKMDRDTKLDALEVRVLKQTAADKVVNDRIVQAALDKSDLAIAAARDENKQELAALRAQLDASIAARIDQIGQLRVALERPVVAAAPLLDHEHRRADDGGPHPEAH
jgi:hypothetical protein